MRFPINHAEFVGKLELKASANYRDSVPFPNGLNMRPMYREIKNQGVVYSVEIGESRSLFVDFCGFFSGLLGGVEREA